MQLRNKRIKLTAFSVAGALVIGLTTPQAARAQFFSDVAYWLQQIALMKQQIDRLESQVSLLQSNYNLAVNQAKSLGTKAGLKTAAVNVLHAATANQYMETSGWSAAMSSSPSSAQSAWRTATQTLPNTSYLGSAQLGNSARLAHLATVEAYDSASISCMSLIAQYRQLEAQGAAAQAALESAQLDTSVATSSANQQLNLLNAADAQKLNELRAQGNLQACLAEQQTVAAKRQRDDMVTDLRFQSDLAHAKATHQTMIDADSAYDPNYLPK